MLEGLLRHDKLGNRDELLLFLFDGISHRQQSVSGLKTYCTSQLFSIGRSFNGILELFRFMGFIILEDENVMLNEGVFNHSEFIQKNYFQQHHFFQHLIEALQNEGVINEVFNSENIKFNHKLNRFYILDNKFPYRYFPLRNLMLSTGFFERDETIPNHLVIRTEFGQLFRHFVVDGIDHRSSRIKMSLSDLKELLKIKEQAGRAAEEFVISFEKTRLNGHPTLDKVVRISEDNVEAGYDIESFSDVDSIVVDRFIEVKSFTSQISFYWSKKEVDTARQLKDKYFLYLVDRERMEEPGYLPKTFQDPYEKIFESELWKKETMNWRITLEV